MILLFIALGILFGCTEDSSDKAPKKKLTQRQRDSVLSESKLPGAKAVGKAIEASDTASARSRRLDSQ
jgi:hypothetical protein